MTNRFLPLARIDIELEGDIKQLLQRFLPLKIPTCSRKCKHVTLNITDSVVTGGIHL